MNSIPDPVPQAALLEILKMKPFGWKVHDLLAFMEEQGYKLGDEILGPVLLFRKNFWLLHNLYRLRNALRKEDAGDLHIRCMDIRYLPEAKGHHDTAIEAYDELETYYLDTQRFWETEEEEVQEILDGFWKRFQAWENCGSLLEKWGIDSSLPRVEIKKQVRALIKTAHPDTGGSNLEFRELWDFWQQYRSSI